jgi:hypothetical protein
MGSSLSRFAAGEGEPSGGDVVISEEEAHAGTARDAKDFLKVMLRAATEKAIGKRLEMSSTTEEVNGLIEMAYGLCGPDRVSATD